MKRARFAFLFAVALSTRLFAAEPAAATAPADLGEGLRYVRVHDLAQEMPALGPVLAVTPALVLDVRYAKAAGVNPDDFYCTLGKHTGAMPLLVLVSPATPAAIAETLAAAPCTFVTLGVREAAPAPKVIIAQSEAEDKKAYDAVEAGQSLAVALSGKVEKERYDEAALMTDFRNGLTDAEPPARPDPTATKPDSAGHAQGQDSHGKGHAPTADDAPKTDSAQKTAAAEIVAPPPSPDRVLQRAVHLHRALLAVKPRP